MKALLFFVAAILPLVAWADTQFGEFQAAPSSHGAEWKVKHEEMKSVPQVFAEAAKMAAKMQETAVWEGLHNHVTKGSHAANGKRLRGGMNCGECEALISVIEGIVRNSTEMNKTITSLDGVCGLVFFGNAKKVSACEDAVKIVTWVFQKLIHLADGLAWNLPLTFCADILKKCTMPCCNTTQVPEQLHLSFASEVDTVSLMRVTWVTLKSTPGAGVFYRVKGSAANFSFAAEEETRTYTQGGWLGVIHTAVMQNLSPATAYEYYVGEPSLGTSPTWSFNTLWSTVGQGSGRPLRIGAIADMGYGPNSDPTVAALSAMAANGTIDVLLHYGDISYADGDEEHWDDFWRKVEPIAARVPYLTTPGNHEMWWNFSAYKARTGWSMPRAGAEVPLDAMYYTVKIGVLQLLMLDSETWIDTPNLGPRQIQWAGRRLAEANKNRSATPWILSVHHRPLYCTTGMHLQCVVFADFLRGQIEALMVAERVDVGIAGHMHHYERTLPVANGFVTSTSYQNPPSPFYFCNGAAGNREGNGMPQVNQPWSVPSSGHKNVGFQVLHLSSDPTANIHTLTSRFLDSATLEVLDEVTVTKSL